ncbi:MAG: LacI family DNA-binding transcriptional regulator [Solirubrobacteraceae bacterium]
MDRSRARSRPPTVVDVANLAGTSRQTVSNVIHGKAHVREQTRKQVLAAIAELEYRPNAAARYLKRQRTTVLGVLVGDLGNPFYSEAARHIEHYAEQRGYTMLLASTGGERETEQRRVESLLEHRVAAIIFLAYSSQRPTIDHIPCVFVAGLPTSHGVFIGVDERKSAEQATSLLLSLGHRRIGYVNTIVSSHPDSDKVRFAGYRRALSKAGIALEDTLIVRLGSGIQTPEAERERSLRRLLSGPDRPTAVFATSDYTALQVMDCADSLELAIPRELSVVGFDNTTSSALQRISLTTVAYPIHELARLSVEAAIDALESSPKRTRILLQPELIVRGSTGPAPARPQVVDLTATEATPAEPGEQHASAPTQQADAASTR